VDLVLGDQRFDHGNIRSSPRGPSRLIVDRLLEKYTSSRALSKWYKPMPVRAVERALYLLFAAWMTLFAARTFYGYMLVQTGGEWSAPLDDVFIHFDYARATARGYPFQWSVGNGYSSGNTSLLYPFVLAFGYWVGFRGTLLMVWAGIVACVSVFALLVAARRLFAPLPAWAKYIAPPALFCIGALDWSLFSGMEVALFLGIWAGALHAALELASRIENEPPRDRSVFRDWELGIWGVFLVVTRPEGATSIAALGLLVAEAARRKEGRRAALATLARATAPAATALVVQAIANRWLTGEFAASGAIVKLTLYNPYMTAKEKLDEYVFLLKYVVFRNTEHHFSDAIPFGYIVPAFAAVPLFFRKTRAVAVALWGSIFSWLAVVALNAQVRWQNERYTMPAVAWVVLLAALGVALLVEPPTLAEGWSLAAMRSKVAAWYGARVTAAAALVVLFAVHQAPCMRDQIWFFGRASRNIRDQHVTAGRVLKQMTPRPKRVLVGDAGALLYASDLPGLDLIGLGGYHDLPFARASVHGLGATLELIERIPEAERPDLFAIYPSWWGDLPSWFGRHLTEVPVRGNVICGGSEKVIYRADWRALGNGAAPSRLGPGEKVIDELDVADLVSEREHGYEFPHPSAGFVDHKVLSCPEDARREMFDAGRRIPAGQSETFRMKLVPGKGARLLARTAPEHEGEIEVRIDGEARGRWHFERADGWREAAVDVPPQARAAVDVTLTPLGADWVDHHVWAVQVP
jgi:hypothetical protein